MAERGPYAARAGGDYAGMVIMGIDASTTSTGWSVFRDKQLIDYGCIKPTGKDWRERLICQEEYISAIVDKYSPDFVAMEDVPLSSNSNKILVILGAVQGFFYGIFAHYKIPVNFIIPSTWRSPIGLFSGDRAGTTRKEMKRKSIEKANELFGLNLQWVSMNSSKNDDDISDAILIGYYEVWRRIRNG